jgi:hypothetical protein
MKTIHAQSVEALETHRIRLLIRPETKPGNCGLP